MLQPVQPKPWKSYIRIPALVILCLLIYTAWIVIRRYREERHFDEAAATAQRAKERENAAIGYESLGGAEFGFMNFYAVPDEVPRGKSSTICYGVSNAKSVSLDPPVEEVWPSVSRCFDVTPKKTTTYKLTIGDGAGHTKSQSFTVTVR